MKRRHRGDALLSSTDGSVVLHFALGPRFRGSDWPFFHPVCVAPEAGGAVAARPAAQRFGAGRQVVVPAPPRGQGWILKRSAVGEADGPGLGTRQPVDRVQVDGGLARLLSAGQEDDPRHGRGHVPAQAPQCRVRHLLHRRRLRALLAGDHHVGLQQHPLQKDTLFEQGVEDGVEHRAGDLRAALEAVRALHQHFRFDDRHELLLLTKGGVARERMSIGRHAGVSRQPSADADDRPPFREPRAKLPIFDEPIAQAVEPLGDRLARRASKRLGAGIDLDAGQHAGILQHAGQRDAARSSLPDSLVVHDCAADPGADTRRREQHLPVRTAALFGRRNVQGREPTRQRADGLVRREDALAPRDQARGHCLKVLGHA
jgi:hypothetical protein